MYFLKRWRKKVDPSGDDPPSSAPLLVRFKDFILVFSLFALNFFFLWPFFGQDYPQVSFSTPVLPLLARALALLTPLNFAPSVGILVLLSFPLASVFWYAFFKKLSGSSLLSFLAGLIFLLPWFFLPRFSLFWQQGDGVHAFGFALLPLVGIIFGQFLKSGSFNLFLASFLGVGLVSLTSPFTLLNLYLIFLILTFSEMLLGQARIKILRFLAVCLFAQGLSAFWYHPQFLLSLLKSNQGQAALSSFWKLFPISFFTLPIFGAFSFLLFDRKPHLQPLFWALTLTILYSGLVAAESLGGYLPFPVPARFLPEFYLGISFLLAIVINFLINLPVGGFDFGKIHPRLDFVHHTPGVFLTAIVTALLAWPVFSFFEGTPIIPFPPSPPVLGAQSVWWEISRDGVSQFVGYGITLLTAAGGAFLKKRTQS